MSQKDIDNTPGVQQNFLYLLGRHTGEKHEYTFVVDTTNLTDTTKPDVKINIVVDKKVIKQIPIDKFISI